MDTKTYISTGIIEQYVLGGLPLEDSSILECVMKNNAEVREAIFDVQKTFELLADSGALEAPSHLKSEIFSRLDFSIPENLTVIPENESPISVPIIPLKVKQSKNSFSKIALIAASVLLIASLGYNNYKNKNQKKEIAQMTASNKVLQTKVTNLKVQNTIILNSKNIKLEGVKTHPGMLANVYWGTSKKVYLKVNNMPSAPEGQQYQLWAIVDGKPVSAGVFDGSQPDKIQSMAVIDKAQAFAITLEKSGGSATPTMENMMVMGTT
ncbi:MAG: anti-sigma factor [Chryseobacterium sp.]|nr:anti-sigma factor [Chryseobacterium sp.]